MDTKTPPPATAKDREPWKAKPSEKAAASSTRLLAHDERDAAERALRGYRQALDTIAEELKTFGNALSRDGHKSTLIRQVELAVNALEQAILPRIENALQLCAEDSSSELLVSLLRRFFEAHPRSQPIDADAFLDDLAVVLTGAGLASTPTDVLHEGRLTPEEVETLNHAATRRGLTNSPNGFCEALTAMGLPDIRTAGGKARLDIYPPPGDNHDALATVVAARIRGRSTRHIGDLETKADAAYDEHGNLFTLLAAGRLKP